MKNVDYILSTSNGRKIELECLDSYHVFLNDFKIDENEFLNWGVESTIFPNLDRVEDEWNY